MTEEQKQALEMRDSGMSRQAIADKMGKSVSAVKSLLERARRDPLVTKIMERNGTEMVPDQAWIKEEWGSVRYSPKKEVEQDLVSRVAEAFKDIPAYEPVPANITQSDELSVYGLFDAHIGMRASAAETGADDYDLKLAEMDIKSAITRLASGGGEALLIIGGDTLHHDNNDNETFASKHSLDVDGRIYKVTMLAVDVIAWAAEHLATVHERVTIKVHRGNHDPHSHVALVAGLTQRYRLAGRITVDDGETDWFWKQWGKCAIFTTHGDKAKPDAFIHKMADICPFWSESPHRMAITGHVHKFQMQRIGGAMWCSVDGFCPPDEYGSQFSGRRGMAKMTFDKERGLTGMKFDPVWRE